MHADGRCALPPLPVFPGPPPCPALPPPPSGHLEDRSKPILFSMARLDKVKNLTGLAEWYAGSERLQGLANLVIVGEAGAGREGIL